MTRGERNNNPGNIDRNATKWQGMADDQSSDPRFIVFKTPQWGIRAIARLMLTYSSAYHLDTVRGIVSRWAPPNENNTSAYVNAVAGTLNVDPDVPIDVDSVAVMLPLVKAIIMHENGEQPYSDAVLLEGLRMAGVADAKPAPLAKQGPFVAQVATGVSVAAAAVSQASGPLKTASDQLSAFTGAPIIAHVQTWLLTAAGACVLIGIAASWLKHRSAQ